MTKRRITLTTNGLNRNGYRVLTQGGRIDAFKKHPVMLFGHNTLGLPVGMWEDIQVDGDKLSAIPVFDTNEPIGVALQSKYDNGFPLAASIGFNVLKSSGDPQYLLPGQTKETVTEWDLMEASIVAVPGNPDATLGVLEPHTLSAIPPITSQINPVMDLTAIVAALGLEASADQGAVLAAIQTLKAENHRLLQAEVENVLAIGRTKGLVTEATEPQYKLFAQANPDALRKLFEASPTPESIDVLDGGKQAPAPTGTLFGMLAAGAPKSTAPATDDRADWSFNDWSQKDPKGLAVMRDKERDRYAKLAAAQYDVA